MMYKTNFFHLSSLCLWCYYTLGMDGYPAPAGFPLTGEIRLRPDCMWHCGSDFHDYSTPFCTKSDVTAQLTVGINHENVLIKPVD